MKPILFHDIDGVLLGEYDGDFQLRPGVKTWLNWVHEHFEVVWLSMRRPEKIKELLMTLYTTQYIEPNEPMHPFTCAQWYDYESKEAYLAMLAQKQPALDWYWIDDRIPTDLPNGLSEWRCIRINPIGDDELKTLRQRLELTVLEYFRTKM